MLKYSKVFGKDAKIMERKPEIEKALYVSPKMTVIRFSAEDIITTSNEVDEDDIPETNDDPNADKNGWV